MREYLLVVDDETTHLQRFVRKVWETAALAATIDHNTQTLTITDKLHAFISRGDLMLESASGDSLRIGGFYDRHPQAQPDEPDAVVNPDEPSNHVGVLDAIDVARRIAEMAKAPDGSKRQWWGCVPDFDAWDHEQLLYLHDMLGEDQQVPWDYHLHCFEGYARGWLAGKGVHVPPVHREIIDALQAVTMADIAAPEEEQHTALGDAMEVVRGLAAIHDLKIVDLTAT